MHKNPEALIKCSKCWQNDQWQIVWQAEIVRPGADVTERKRQRIYLSINVAQQHRGIMLLNDKPAQLNATGSMASKIRKHIPGCLITKILVSPATNAICIPLYSRPQNPPAYYLLLDDARPPALELINDNNESLLRYGQGGTYTKAKLFQGQLADDGWRDILPRLIDELALPAAATTTTNETAAPELAAQRELGRRLARKLKTLKKAQEKQEQHVPQARQAEHLMMQAHLLQRFLYRIQPGASELVLGAAETGTEATTIPLDENLEPGANLEALFLRAKRARHAKDASGKQLSGIEHDLRIVADDLARLRGSELVPATELAVIARRHQLQTSQASSKSKTTPVAKPFKTFLSATGTSIFVAKSAADGDQLLKAAKANDFWFHCVGATGSHVIVPFQKSFAQGLPPETEHAAAMLALHHSTLRQNHAGEVYRSRRQFLRKRKGMPAGLWTIERSETIFVKYTAAELEELFARHP